MLKELRSYAHGLHAALLARPALNAIGIDCIGARTLMPVARHALSVLDFSPFDLLCKVRDAFPDLFEVKSISNNKAAAGAAGNDAAAESGMRLVAKTLDPAKIKYAVPAYETLGPSLEETLQRWLVLPDADGADGCDSTAAAPGAVHVHVEEAGQHMGVRPQQADLLRRYTDACLRAYAVRPDDGRDGPAFAGRRMVLTQYIMREYEARVIAALLSPAAYPNNTVNMKWLVSL